MGRRGDALCQQPNILVDILPALCYYIFINSEIYNSKPYHRERSVSMKKDYMTRLERAARWRLPPKEAEEVIADYREMVGDPPRPEEELLRDLGKPKDAVRPLVQKRPYCTWLAVFLVLSACVLTLGISPFDWRLWRLYFDSWTDSPSGGALVAVLGAVTALVWFRRQGRKAARLPRAIPILLAALLACCGGVMLFCWACARDFEGFLNIWGTMPSWIGPDRLVSVSLNLSQDAMIYGSIVIAAAAEFWLVKARIRDRRWAAVYILSLAAMLAALSVVALSTSMNPLPLTPEELFRRKLLESAGITAVGLIGAGVALC